MDFRAGERSELTVEEVKDGRCDQREQMRIPLFSTTNCPKMAKQSAEILKFQRSVLQRN